MAAEDSPNEEPKEKLEGFLSSQQSIEVELEGQEVYSILWPEDGSDRDLRNARAKIILAVCNLADANDEKRRSEKTS